MQKHVYTIYGKLEARDIYIYKVGGDILFKVFGSLVPGYYHLKADPSIVFFDGEVSISIGEGGDLFSIYFRFATCMHNS